MKKLLLVLAVVMSLALLSEAQQQDIRRGGGTGGGSGTTLTNASASGVQLINPATNAILTLTPTNGFAVFTNATGVILGSTNSGTVVKRSIVTVTNRYTFTGNVLGVTTNSIFGDGFPVATNTFTPTSTGNRLRVSVGTLLSADSARALGFILSASGTNLAQQVIGSVPAVNGSINGSWTQSGLTILGTTNTEFILKAWQSGAGIAAVGRFSNADIPYGTISFILEEYIP